jgi:NAD(P)-dependent dehydrogenase (short-subunit alcohol dehydrogenase family)
MTTGGAVLVTGAASGIGRACCDRFLAEGYAVHGWDVTDGADERIGWTSLDVSDWDAVEAAAKAYDELDAVVHCAAIARVTPVLEMSREDWDRTIAVNLNGSYYVARHLHRPLAARAGVLVLVASVNARNTTQFRAPYNASKAAVVSLTQALAVEWALAGSPVRVLAVSPGLTRTPQPMEKIRTGRVSEAELLARVPAHRWIEPEEIAAAVFRFTGPDFSALHGENVFLDAGFNAWGGRS